MRLLYKVTRNISEWWRHRFYGPVRPHLSIRKEVERAGLEIEINKWRSQCKERSKQQ